jgi:hypothetical protein
MFDGEVEHRRRDESEVYHIDSFVTKAVLQSRRQLGRMGTRIAPDRNRTLSDEMSDGSTDPISHRRIQFVRDHTSNVVRFENCHVPLL